MLTFRLMMARRCGVLMISAPVYLRFQKKPVQLRHVVCCIDE